jgi:uncharacterized lipoprotein YmbA
MHTLSFLILIASVLLSACSIPETKIYNLNLIDSGETRNMQYKKTDSPIAVHVEAPSYLSQPYIVTRTSPYQIKISKTEKWISPPKRFIRKSLKDVLFGTGSFRDVRISRTHPEGYCWLVVDLKKFGLLNDKGGFWAELVMDVSFFNHEMNRLFMRTVAHKKQLENREYSKLAHVLSTLLAEGLEEIKVDVMQHIRIPAK